LIEIVIELDMVVDIMINFSQKKTGLAVGLAYEEQIINEIPIEEHDKKLDFIITDERVINCV
jgi:5-formyltetrahydrofolate cyclo-ligase